MSLVSVVKQINPKKVMCLLKNSEGAHIDKKKNCWFVLGNSKKECDVM
jgi:hypothetical protein